MVCALKGKCQFSCPRITFLGHIIDVDGISPDPSKTESVRNMKATTTITELKSMGIGRIQATFREHKMAAFNEN